MKHFVVTINVAYDMVPASMCEELKAGVDSAIQRGLLNDADANVIIDDYRVNVEECTCSDCLDHEYVPTE